ncbi:GNAT family N-acetyltransferase [Abyssibius alkaniclasticus]|uniref:GNAT family N-acetyltransferase n=1 Tax=Abyssibius alkaniclasticus TaxID=2881234 RepID=UPI004057D72F
MVGFFGTEKQMALQAAAEEAREWTMNTSGACDPGRFLGTDNPEALGWGKIIEILKRDGAFGFRMIPAADTTAISRRLNENACRIDFWDEFAANREDAVASSSEVIASGLPKGYSYLPQLHEAENQEMVKVQSFMVENGIAPFSGTKLAGLDGPAVTVAIVDDSNNLAAVAHACFSHNKYSQYNRWAWGGLVAVSPSYRGMGLGKFVNAKMVSDCFSSLDADFIIELVAASNTPSRKMVEASGLRLEPTVKCGIAVTEGEERFTK